MGKWPHGVPIVLMGLVVAGCTITRAVEPISAPLASPLCIRENDAVWSKEFLPALREELTRHGIRSVVYRDTRPEGCRYHATYTARWGWDLATYLEYTDIEVFDGEQTIGRAVYDAGGGSATFEKFGSTRSKLRSLIEELIGARGEQPFETHRGAAMEEG